ncbi:endopeptidase La [Thorsellia kenyensis]|uniref:Lon protease n=1 Tax=Thorsellia kenyensis TaxID=1549888 RepID=A0ABV6C895_9GAMM
MAENIKTEEQTTILPVLPLRDVVIYPNMVIPLFVGRIKSIDSLEYAMLNTKQILLVAQKESTIDDPSFDDLYQIGTIANILQMLKLPDGTVKVLVEGTERAEILEKNPIAEVQFLSAEIQLFQTKALVKKEKKALVNALLEHFESYIKLSKRIPKEVLANLEEIEDAEKLADAITAHMPFKLSEKQDLLEMRNLLARFDFLMEKMTKEIEVLQMEKKIRNRVKSQMEKSQKEYYLNEQMKAIQKELGELDPQNDELEELNKKILKAQMPEAIQEKVLAELNKLKMMSSSSPEATVLRTYIDWMIQLPWAHKSKIKTDIKKAELTLNKDHFGLEKVKERILEYLAVQARVKQLKGPILCLVGPPGVGKTSLGQSIAKATGREYQRIALGGVRDEAEIRGHRRTYIGAMPGKLIQKMAKVGVSNPLILLDEIDKMASDMRGDPASAMLEVLDPEQNNAFNDHYIDVDYDLSDVMFVATANSLNIPGPLLDRMEVIRLSGYTEDEKLNIAKKHLLPKQLERNGLQKTELKIEDSAIVDIIRYYTREAGVRNLERELAKICRKAVKSLISVDEPSLIKVNAKNLSEYIGVKRFDYGRADKDHRIGQVTGLAWTEVGGDLLNIEAASMVGKGKLNFTGSLGDVMKESIQAAMTVVRSKADKLGINEDFYEKRDIHVHVPEGATPKDGPSAGIAMCTTIVSALTGNPVRKDVAMTGEVTLQGQVLAIGGLKEKLLAAHRGGIKLAIIPKDNIKDLEELPANILSSLEVKPVSHVDEVLSLALVNPPFGFSIDK